MSEQEPLFEVEPSRRLAHPLVAPNLRALQEDVPAGRCLGCDAPLPKSKGRKPRTALCGDPECKRLYDMTCAMDSRWRSKTYRRENYRGKTSRQTQRRHVEEE